LVITLFTLFINTSLKKKWKEMLTLIPESPLEVFVVEELGDKIVWEEENKEFSIEGALYDVARIKKIDGKNFFVLYK
jgi:hypothetical protein